MSGNTVIRRLRKPALALGACVGFGVLAPMYLAERASDDSFAGSAVLASPRDLYVITVPVRLSSAPDLTLNRAVIYDYGQSVPPGGVSQVVLDGPVLSLNAAGLGATEGPGGIEAEPVPPLIQQIGALGFDVVAIRRGTLHVVMGDGDVETLTDIQAEVKKDRRGQIASQGSFTVRGQRLAFDTTFGQPDKTQPQRWPLQVSFKASLLQGTFNGHADLSEGLQLVGQTELAITSLRRVGRWFGLPLYVTEGFNATTVKGDLTWARRSLAFEKARIAVDGNEGNGRLALNLAGDRPLLEATLDFANLNLTPYLDAARTQLFGFELPVTWGASFDTSLPMIRYLDADMRISANRIALKDLGFGQGGATVTAQAGKLRADIAEVELPSGGSLSAQVTAIMTEAVPRYAVRAKVESLEMGPATARLLGSPALTGRAGLTFDLTSTGYTLTELTRRLSGKAALSMPEGGRLALDLRAVRQAAKAGQRGWAALARSHTNVERLEARSLIIDGVAFAEDIQARAGDLALALAGRLGLVDGNMDARLVLKPGAPSDASQKPADAGASEVVTLRGPWPDPMLRAEDSDATARPAP
ncbi:MAG TPA: AsmA-like C-terminal region-containing protein [Hyphomicrobiaceae bacterium]|jgi:AsmA protein|nr:AsmA-like C-terminal region-containing protein [Hyphomicrobiaceae bacterium]